MLRFKVNFYFGVLSMALFVLLFTTVGSVAGLSYFQSNGLVSLQQAQVAQASDAFFSKDNVQALETPDLKIVDNSFVYGISTPQAMTTQTLGTVMGGSPAGPRTEVEEYVVQPGDTVTLVAGSFGISTSTILWANDLAAGAPLKVGQSLVILPVSGILHAVKSGDTVADIAAKYKISAENIIASNSLTDSADIFVGDLLIIPGGVVLKKAPAIAQAPLADSFFIYPVEGTITQGLHYYNGVDVANQCGTPVYAAAAGTVQRIKFDYRYGNYITILHSNGVVSYYGHLQTVSVKPGDAVNVGDRVALMGRTGTLATGCHLHFQVLGAKNPLAKFSKGATLKYK